MSFSGTKGYLTKPKSGVLLNPLHPLSRGLVGCYLFNEGAGSLANDISGHGNHGTLMNMAPNAQGSGWGGSKLGGGLEFDGVNDYVLATTKGMNVNNGSIALWFNTRSVPSGVEGNNYMLAHRTGADNNRIYMYLRDDTSTIVFGHGTTAVIDTGFTPSVYTRYCIVLAWDNANVDYYINGISYGPTITATLTSIDTNIYIGCQYNLGSVFNGSNDLTLFYNRTLSANEAKQLHQTPFCNLMPIPIRRYSVAVPPVGVIMNQFQGPNIGADLYNGAILA